jgi:hypothetical protein
MATRKLAFEVRELSKESRAFLEEHGMMQQDYKSYWMSKDALADDERPGVSVDSDDEVQISEEFWEALGLPEVMKNEILAFWTQYPEGEIEWEA